MVTATPQEPGREYRARPGALFESAPWARGRSRAARAERGRADAATMRLSRGLGWFALGLGVAQIVAPRALGTLAGVADVHPLIMRAVGIREVASGLGILTQPRPAGWMWARVAGDAMDLAMLGAGFASRRAHTGRLAASAAAVAGVMALDVLAARQLSRGLARERPIPVERSIVINRPPEDCYAFWRELDNLPRFMTHLESVTSTGDGRSHWVARGPAGSVVEWDAEIIEDRPNEVLAWRAVEPADVDNFGSVRFEAAPGGRGTIVRVQMHYTPPAGRVGAFFAKLLGEEPGLQVREDLRRLKQVLETGEIATTRGQPHGRRSFFARATREGRL